MKPRRTYRAPELLQTVGVSVERRFLDASIAPALTVESVGQEVEEKDFSTGNFNFEWE
jgi:hypothetical protein